MDLTAVVQLAGTEYGGTKGRLRRRQTENNRRGI